MSETVIINGPVVIVLPPPFEETEKETPRDGETVNLLESEQWRL